MEMTPRVGVPLERGPGARDCLSFGAGGQPGQGWDCGGVTQGCSAVIKGLEAIANRLCIVYSDKSCIKIPFWGPRSSGTSGHH